MNPKPCSSIEAAIRSGGSSSDRPSSSRTSAEPQAELAARFPCFATAAPAAAATIAAAVEMLNVRAPSPPVPTTSTTGDRVGTTGTTCSRMRLREAGDLVDGLALGAQADEQRADLRGRRLALHHAVHHRARLVARQVAPVGERGDRRRDHERKFLAIAGPSGVRTLSGWNWTPSIGQLGVADAHHLAVGRARGHGELVGDGRRRERVVPADLDLVRQARVDACAVVRDDARLAVEKRLRLADRAAERLDDRLVAEADAERPGRRAERLDQLDRDAGVAGPAGPRRDDEPVGCERERLVAA